MNTDFIRAFQITGALGLGLVALGAVVLGIAWINDRWARRRCRPVFEPESLEHSIRKLSTVTTVLQTVLCALIGLIGGLMLYCGWVADLPPWLR